MKGWRQLRKHLGSIQRLVYCQLRQRAPRPLGHCFVMELGAEWVQFIPIIERATADTIQIANLGWSEQPGQKRMLYTQSGNLVTKRSVGGEQYGRFLIHVRGVGTPLMWAAFTFSSST